MSMEYLDQRGLAPGANWIAEPIARGLRGLWSGAEAEAEELRARILGDLGFIPSAFDDFLTRPVPDPVQLSPFPVDLPTEEERLINRASLDEAIAAPIRAALEKDAVEQDLAAAPIREVLGEGLAGVGRGMEAFGGFMEPTTLTAGEPLPIMAKEFASPSAPVVTPSMFSDIGEAMYDLPKEILPAVGRGITAAAPYAAPVIETAGQAVIPALGAYVALQEGLGVPSTEEYTQFAGTRWQTPTPAPEDVKMLPWGEAMWNLKHGAPEINWDAWYAPGKEQTTIPFATQMGTLDIPIPPLFDPAAEGSAREAFLGLDRPLPWQEDYEVMPSIAGGKGGGGIVAAEGTEREREIKAQIDVEQFKLNRELTPEEKEQVGKEVYPLPPGVRGLAEEAPILAAEILLAKGAATAPRYLNKVVRAYNIYSTGTNNAMKATGFKVAAKGFEAANIVLNKFPEAVIKAPFKATGKGFSGTRYLYRAGITNLKTRTQIENSLDDMIASINEDIRTFTNPIGEALEGFNRAVDAVFPTLRERSIPGGSVFREGLARFDEATNQLYRSEIPLPKTNLLMRLSTDTLEESDPSLLGKVFESNVAVPEGEIKSTRNAGWAVIRARESFFLHHLGDEWPDRLSAFEDTVPLREEDLARIAEVKQGREEMLSSAMREQLGAGIETVVTTPDMPGTQWGGVEDLPYFNLRLSSQNSLFEGIQGEYGNELAGIFMDEVDRLNRIAVESYEAGAEFPVSELSTRTDAIGKLFEPDLVVDEAEVAREAASFIPEYGASSVLDGISQYQVPSELRQVLRQVEMPDKFRTKDILTASETSHAGQRTVTAQKGPGAESALHAMSRSTSHMPKGGWGADPLKTLDEVVDEQADLLGGAILKTYIKGQITMNDGLWLVRQLIDKHAERQLRSVTGEVMSSLEGPKNLLAQLYFTSGIPQRGKKRVDNLLTKWVHPYLGDGITIDHVKILLSFKAIKNIDTKWIKSAVVRDAAREDAFNKVIDEINQGFADKTISRDKAVELLVQVGKREEISNPRRLIKFGKAPRKPNQVGPAVPMLVRSGIEFPKGATKKLNLPALVLDSGRILDPNIRPGDYAIGTTAAYSNGWEQWGNELVKELTEGLQVPKDVRESLLESVTRLGQADRGLPSELQAQQALTRTTITEDEPILGMVEDFPELHDRLTRLFTAAVNIRNEFRVLRKEKWNNEFIDDATYEAWEEDFDWYLPMNLLEYHMNQTKRLPKGNGNKIPNISNDLYARHRDKNIYGTVDPLNEDVLYRQFISHEMKMHNNIIAREFIALLQAMNVPIKNVTAKYKRKYGADDVKHLYDDKTDTGFIVKWGEGEQQFWGMEDPVTGAIKPIDRLWWNPVFGRGGMGTRGQGTWASRLHFFALTNSWTRATLTTFDPLFAMGNLFIDGFVALGAARVLPTSVVIRLLETTAREILPKFNKKAAAATGVVRKAPGIEDVPLRRPEGLGLASEAPLRTLAPEEPTGIFRPGQGYDLSWENLVDVITGERNIEDVFRMGINDRTADIMEHLGVVMYQFSPSRVQSEIRREIREGGQVGAILIDSNRKKELADALQDASIWNSKPLRPLSFIGGNYLKGARWLSGEAEQSPRRLVFEKTLRRLLGSEEWRRLERLKGADWEYELFTNYNNTGKGLIDHDAVRQAGMNALDATVNFSRGGTGIRFLNNYFMFLNAAFEGAKLPFRMLGVNLSPTLDFDEVTGAAKIGEWSPAAKQGWKRGFGGGVFGGRGATGIGLSEREVFASADGLQGALDKIYTEQFPRRLSDAEVDRQFVAGGVHGAPALAAMTMASANGAYLAIMYYNMQFEEYWDIPAYIRYNSLIFMLAPETDEDGNVLNDSRTGRPTPRYITVPHRLRELALYFGTTAYIAEKLFSSDEESKQALGLYVTTLIEAASPVSEMPLPELLTIGLEQTQGRDMFKNRPIVDPSLMGEAPVNQHNQYTSPTWKKAAEGLDAIGLTKVPGLGTYASPQRLQHLAETIYGGTGKRVVDEVDYAVFNLNDIFSETDTAVDRANKYRGMNKVEQREFRSNLSTEELEEMRDILRDPVAYGAQTAIVDRLPVVSSVKNRFSPSYGGGIEELGKYQRSGFQEDPVFGKLFGHVKGEFPDVSVEDSTQAAMFIRQFKDEATAKTKGYDAELMQFLESGGAQGLSPAAWNKSVNTAWDTFREQELKVKEDYPSSIYGQFPDDKAKHEEAKDRWFKLTYGDSHLYPEDNAKVNSLLVTYYNIPTPEEDPTRTWTEYFQDQAKMRETIKAEDAKMPEGEQIYDLFEAALLASKTPMQEKKTQQFWYMREWFDVGSTLDQLYGEGAARSNPALARKWSQYLAAPSDAGDTDANNRFTKEQLRQSDAQLRALVSRRAAMRRSIVHNDTMKNEYAGNSPVLDLLLTFWYGAEWYEPVTQQGQNLLRELYGR